MSINKLHITILLGLAFVMLSSLVWWISTDPTNTFSASVPGADNPKEGSGALEEIHIGEFFERFARKSNELEETWPRFRGEDVDNIYKPNRNLINNFTADQEILWSVELGEGHAGAAIYKGLVYILDYDEEKRADVLNCISLTTGEVIWQRWYKVNVKRNHGMSRTVPAVTDDYILTMGPRCHVMCVERETGDFLWGIDIEREYNSEVPLWYTGQCPLIVDDVAILATGGDALLIGVDCKTGEKLWETPNPNEWKMSHSSVMPYEYQDKKMFVYAAVGGVCAVSAEKRDAGEMLWETSAFDHSVVAPAPVCMPDGKIFLTAGYGAGAMMLQLQKVGDGFSVEVLQEYKPSDGLACEQQTPIYFEGHLFGILPKDGGTNRNQLVCVHPDNPNEFVWTSGKEDRFGLGPYILADGKFYLLKDDGELYIIEATTNGYTKFSQKKILDGHDAWAPLAIADGYMVLRDSKTMACININAN
jgi:outer membrane protein assembly factor BamB